MANTHHQLFAQGKKVYYVNGKRFYNSKQKNDGNSKAEEYCLDNFLDIKTSIIQFDSDTECDYYEYLLNKQSKGEISNLTHHFKLRVQEQFENSNGDVIPEVTYNADFIYLDLITNKRMVVDVKSSEYFLSNDGGRFILLKSVFDKVFKEKGYYIQIILKDKESETGWREWHIGDAKKPTGKRIQQQRESIKQYRKKLNNIEKQQRLEEREKARLIELRDLKAKKKLSKAQRSRLDELEKKYSI